MQRILQAEAQKARSKGTSHSRVYGWCSRTARVDASTAIHSTILRGVVSTAGQAGIEQPPSAMSWLLSDNIDMLMEWAALCSHVAACSHGMDYYKSWALCASFGSIAQLASVCTHPPGSHSTIAGARTGDKYISELTAEYTPSLARSMAPLFAPYATSQGWLNASIADFADLLTLLQQAQPVSRKKAQLGTDVTWCGWSFFLEFETVHLSQSKLAKLRDQLRTLHSSRKVSRKLLEATLGLLMWATGTRPHLRPYMAPLDKDLHSAVGILKLIHPQMWHHFLDALDESAKVARQPVGLWLRVKAQVIRAGSHEVQSKTDLPKVISAQKGMWVRIADPQRSELHLRKASRDALQWLFFTCFAHGRLRPLRQKSVVQCFAAADATADGDIVGIGGWIITAQHCAWFAVQWQASELRAIWPQLCEAPQRFITCF